MQAIRKLNQRSLDKGSRLETVNSELGQLAKTFLNWLNLIFCGAHFKIKLRWSSPWQCWVHSWVRSWRIRPTKCTTRLNWPAREVVLVARASGVSSRHGHVSPRWGVQFDSIKRFLRGVRSSQSHHINWFSARRHQLDATRHNSVSWNCHLIGRLVKISWRKNPKRWKIVWIHALQQGPLNVSLLVKPCTHQAFGRIDGFNSALLRTHSLGAELCISQAGFTRFAPAVWWHNGVLLQPRRVIWSSDATLIPAEACASLEYAV